MLTYLCWCPLILIQWLFFNGRIKQVDTTLKTWHLCWQASKSREPQQYLIVFHYDLPILMRTVHCTDLWSMYSTCLLIGNSRIKKKYKNIFAIISMLPRKSRQYAQYCNWDWPMTRAKQQKDVTRVTSGLLLHQIRCIKKPIPNSTLNGIFHLLPWSRLANGA